MKFTYKEDEAEVNHPISLALNTLYKDIKQRHAHSNVLQS